MDTAIDRIFRFIEMIGITALIKAVVVPAYPAAGEIIVVLLGVGAAAYLINPAVLWSIEALSRGATENKQLLFAGVATGILVMLAQVFLLQPLVVLTSNLIKSTLSVAEIESTKST